MVLRLKQKNVSYARYGYIFCIPFVIAFLIFLLYPLVFTAVIGFTDLAGMAATDWNFLDDPFENFVNILNNNTFRVSLGNTFFIWIINFIPQMVLALLLTAWFTSRRHKFIGMGTFKILFYMPNIITAASIGVLFNVLFMFPIGPINDILMRLGIRDEAFNFLVHGRPSQLIVAFIQFWMWYGYTMLILISGVLGQNPSMYEAADIDGANGIQIFFRVTLPNLRTIMLFMFVTSLVGGLNMFDIPRVFNDGLPDNATRTVSLFIFNQAFMGRFMYNRAAAASMIVFVIIAVLSAFIFFAMRDRDAAREKKAQKALDKSIKKAGGVRV